LENVISRLVFIKTGCRVATAKRLPPGPCGKEKIVVTEPFDPKKSYMSVKANEGMISFVSFLINLEEGKAAKEGILKISSFIKPYGGGYLTLTFIVDTGGAADIKERLDGSFEGLTEQSLRDHMGAELERMNKVSLDTVAHIENWYLEEINVHFRRLEGVEKTIVEQSLLPALENALPCTFQPVEWWPMEKVKQAASSEQDWVDQVSTGSVKTLFRKWFGSD